MDRDAARWEVYETGDAAVLQDAWDVGNLKTTLAPALSFKKIREGCI